MRIVEALSLYDQAERSGYDATQCGSARWTCYMLGGEWERAWSESDKIAQRGGLDPHGYWDGASWAGKDVLLRCLHGLGDTLQFIRYATLIRQQARSFTVEAQPPLQALIQSSGLADRVITWGDPEPDWQVQMEVNELPRVFRTTIQTIPDRVPYLVSGRPSTASNTDSRLKIGLVWAASSFDVTRNIPLEMIEPLLKLPGLAFYSLQGGEGWTASLPTGLTNLVTLETRIEEVAKHVADLDLILDGGHNGRAPGRGTRASNLDNVAFPVRLAMDDDSARHAMVSHDAALPTTVLRELGGQLLNKSGRRCCSSISSSQFTRLDLEYAESRRLFASLGRFCTCLRRLLMRVYCAAKRNQDVI